MCWECLQDRGDSLRAIGLPSLTRVLVVEPKEEHPAYTYPLFKEKHETIHIRDETSDVREKLFRVWCSTQYIGTVWYILMLQF